MIEELTDSRPQHQRGRSKKKRRPAHHAAYGQRSAFNLTETELERFNRLHPRGFGGKFGHKLAQLAGVGINDQNTEIQFPDVGEVARRFDWEEPDPERPGRDVTYLNITGPTQLEDDETGETYTDEVTVKLHMEPPDYEAWGRAMSAALLREKLRASPLPVDDPRALYVAALLDMQNSDTLDFNGENPWGTDQHLEWTFNPDDDTYRIIAQDEWGDETDMTLSAAEFTALHAQVMRRYGTGVQPSGAKPPPGRT